MRKEEKNDLREEEQMNKQRRAKLEELLPRIEALKADLEGLQAEEQDYYDAMPEGLQGGEKGALANDAIDAMQTACDALDEATDNIEQAVQ